MKFGCKKRLSLLLPLIVVVLILLGTESCAKESIEKEKPFVRLIEDEVLKSDLLNQTVRYAVLLPENYNTSADSFAVVYLLHGFGDNYTAWYKGGAIQFFADKLSAEIVPMIFVMMDGFNSYYVNKYNGRFPYMDMFTKELVPLIDSLYRTKKDKSQRAVMGYSMGGYGALILPCKNPDMFGISVPLSISFRTDEQYISESQSGWNYQWASVFGGSGASGADRLTDYYIENNPFYFFNAADISKYNSLRFFIDCGDDEESLYISSGELHNLMRDKSISHEYRVRNGGHSWDYWHLSMDEALRFISDGFQNLNYPDNDSISIDHMVSSEQYSQELVSNTNIQIGVFKPDDYKTTVSSYPVIYFFYDSPNGNETENGINIISFLNDNMLEGKIPKSIIVEIPQENFTSGIMTEILNQISENYRVIDDQKTRILIGNDSGGSLACTVLQSFPDTFNACFLYNSKLTGEESLADGVYYYIDVTDEAEAYRENFNFFLRLREGGVDHEYRVRQGRQDERSVLKGLSTSLSSLAKNLKN